MPRACFLMVASGFFAVSSVAWASGCGTTYDDCVSGKISACKGIYTGTAGAGGSGGGGGGGGSDGGNGGSPPLVCKGDPTLDPTIVDGSCGVFAKADAAVEGNGDKETPYRTLQAAIDEAAATGRWVFACTSGEFNENIVISKGVEVYGGFDCSTREKWAWKKGTRARLTGTPNAIALTVVQSAQAVLLEDLAITAAPSAPGEPGGSSIAVLLEEVKADLVRCDITAQDAVAGASGDSADSMPPPQPVKTGDNDGKHACTVLGNGQAAGGDEFSNDCGGGAFSIGGLGGSSTQNGSKSGEPGTSTPQASSPKGAAGMGDTSCSGGGKGGDGADGDAGAPGPPGTGIGTLSPSTGWVGVPGQSGEAGRPAQGGGGGGGRKGGNTICSGGPGSGPTGGSGGAGGCGGLPGKGGGAGGSSIALISIDTNGSGVTLTECKLVAGEGGAGGKGGDAQPGGPGGMAGAGGSGPPGSFFTACDGGEGGTGGGGGPGGGGAGGHSLAIAYTTVKPTLVKTTLERGGAGAPGLGGAVGTTMGLDGDPGVAPADGTLMFPQRL